MELSTDKFLIGPFVFERIGKIWSPAGREAVGLIRDDGTIIAGVVFEDRTPVCMSCHIALDHTGVPVRRLLSAAAHYAYNQCGVEKLLGMVPSDNLAALAFDMRIGFKPEAVIKNVYPHADLVVLSMTRDDCKFIPRMPKAA